MSRSGSTHVAPTPEEALRAEEETRFVRDGVPRTTLRKLRRGHWAVQAELDLHGLNRVDAAAALDRFIASCAARGHRCVRVIHGKGLRSAHGRPVLKIEVRARLARSEAVWAYCEAPDAQGGSGALLALLAP